jgi:hypothetical protein
MIVMEIVFDDYHYYCYFFSFCMEIIRFVLVSFSMFWLMTNIVTVNPPVLINY